VIVGNEYDTRRKAYAYHQARLKTNIAKEVYMDRVDETAERYLSQWDDSYRAVNDREIVCYMVRAAMNDIQKWIESDTDFDGGRAQAGYTDWSRDELIELYRVLSPTAAFFDFVPRSYRGSDGPP